MTYPVRAHSDWTQSIAAAWIQELRILLSRCFLFRSSTIKVIVALNAATIALQRQPVVKRPSQICDFFVNWTCASALAEIVENPLSRCTRFIVRSPGVFLSRFAQGWLAATVLKN